MSGGVEAMRLVEEANQRRYVALRDFFLRLADEIFGLRQDFPDQGPVGAILKQARLAQNPLPEAVLSLSLQAVKDAVLGLLQPAEDSAELPSDQPAATAGARLLSEEPKTEPKKSQPAQAAGPSPGRAAVVPRPLEVPVKGVLAILGGESAERDFRVELVESMEPLRTSLCDQRLWSWAVRAGSVAVVDTEVPNSALLLSSVRSQPLRVTFRPEEEWVMKTEPVSETRWDHRFAAQAVSVDGRVYVAGGIKNKRTLADVFVLSGSAEAAEMPSMRTGRCGHALLAFGGGLVAVGGLSGAKAPLASVEGLRLGEAGAEWRALPDLPRPLYSLGAVVFKGRLFVAGGADSRGVGKDVYSLGPQSERWEAEGQLTWARSKVCLAVVGGQLFALGGVFGRKGADESWARSVEVFEERERRWRLLPGKLRLPVSRSLALPIS